MVNWKNKDEVRGYYRTYHKREKSKQQKKKYYVENKEKILENCSNWGKENPKKLREKNRRMRKKYPEKFKARMYANNHNQRGNRCLFCYNTEKLSFHHTSYIDRMGFTVCTIHHQEQEQYKRELK